MSTAVSLPPLGPPVDEVWDVILDLAQHLPAASWTLIGGQMVLLHVLEHGQDPPQISQDGDVAGNVRSDPTAVGAIVTELEGRGFIVEGMTPDGLAHR